MKGEREWAVGALVMIVCLCVLTFWAVSTLVSQ